MKYRSPTLEDLGAVAALVREVELADYGEAEDSEEDIQVQFGMIDPERDAWIVEEGGEVVAIGGVRVRHPTRLRAFAAIRPSHTGRGIGTELLRRIDERAREVAAEAPPEETVSIGQDAAPTNQAAKELLERHGYELVRHFWKMGIDLAEEPAEPMWPDGIRLEPMTPELERAAFDASEDAFQDHWEFTPHDYGEWRAWTVEHPVYDPALWVIARDGDEIAGISFNYAREKEEGWVGVLGVRPPWRRKGLGLAILLESLRRLRERGLPRASLHVDSENPTGATRLYERAGMSVVNLAHAYRKEICR